MNSISGSTIALWFRRSQLSTVGISEEELEMQDLTCKIRFALNRITPENYKLIVAVIVSLPINSSIKVTKFSFMIFERAIIEPLYCELYAKLCRSLIEEDTFEEVRGTALPSTLKSSLINHCVQEFERLLLPKSHQVHLYEEQNNPSVSLQELNYSEMMKRRKLFGCMQFIGELFNLELISESVIYEVADKLIASSWGIDFLCKLFQTVGGKLDQSDAKLRLDQYIESMEQLLNNPKNLLPSRLKFAFMDLVELRQKNWISTKVLEKPKPLAEL